MREASRQDISLVELTPTHKRALALLCDKHKLGYESQSAGAGGVGPNIMKVWKFVSTEEFDAWAATKPPIIRSEEHTSELQSLMRISYDVFCLNKKKQNTR